MLLPILLVILLTTQLVPPNPLAAVLLASTASALVSLGAMDERRRQLRRLMRSGLRPPADRSMIATGWRRNTL